jgi:predicted deacylase
VLDHLEMQNGDIEPSDDTPVECRRAHWLYTQQAGVLEVYPDVEDIVNRGDKIGRLTNVFGDRIAEYTAPESGIVLGKSVNPVCQAGGRILYLGITRQNTGRD